MTACYLTLFSVIIWIIVDVHYNNTSYRAYIIEEFKYFKILAGISVGLGFVPLTILVVYYWISKYFRNKESSQNNVNIPMVDIAE